MSVFTYRTFNPLPSSYERELANALFSIMGQRIHDPAGIAVELNKTSVRPAGGVPWTDALLKSEMHRLGRWTNCIGCPVGGHTLPGASQRSVA